MDIGPRGVWLSHLPEGSDTLPGAIEEAGYDVLWIAGGARPGIFDTIHAVLAATVFHFGTLRVADVKDAIAAAGHPVRRSVWPPAAPTRETLTA